MTLFKIDEDHLNNQTDQADLVGDTSILKAQVCAHTEHGSEQIGRVEALLVDDRDRLRYLVVDTGFWVFGKKILLPIGCCVDDPERNRIYVTGLTKSQVNRLPNYSDETIVDERYEAQLQSVYLSPVETAAPVEGDVPVEETVIKPSKPVNRPAAVEANRADNPPPRPQPAPANTAAADLYRLGDEHQRLRLYEERLMATKQRHKTGEVTVTKRIETVPATASVPVEKEKVIIEIESVKGTTQVNVPDGELSTDEAAHIDLHTEQAHIRKEPVVRQEVTIRKAVDEEVVTAQETLRRETLDVEQSGNPPISDRSSD